MIRKLFWFLIGFFAVFSFFLVQAEAGEEEIGLEWDPNVEVNIGGYGAYIGDVPGGPYTKIGDIVHPTVEFWYTYDAPNGVITRKYFVVDAHNTDTPTPLRSIFSNEVFWDYDWAPIEAATEFAAAEANDVVTFIWKQGDIGRIEEWKLYMGEVQGGPYDLLITVPYSGTPGDTYTTSQEMTVNAGEMKTFYFTLVTFTPNGVFSGNSMEVSVVIDKRVMAPINTLRIKVRTQ